MRSILWACIAFSLANSAVQAQETSEPRIVLVQPGVSALNADLLSLTNLTSEEEKAYGADLEAFIQDFALGIDTERPVLVEVLTSSTPVTYLFWLPFEDRLDFLDNLDSIGFPAFVQPDNADLYLIDDEVDQGWLRLLVDKKYALLALTMPETQAQVKKQVLAAAFPESDLKRLTADVSAVAHLSNAQQDEASQKARRGTFAALRADDMRDIKKRPAEAASEFAVRQASSTIFYDELERIYSDTSDIDVQFKLDRQKSVLNFVFEVAGIDGSSLGTSISQFGQATDAFAAISPLPNNVLSGRLNHPVDDLRKQNANIYLDLLNTDIHRRIEESESLQDAQKQATQKIYDDVITIFRNGFNSGNVNGFVEAIHDGSDFTLVGAVSAPGSALLTQTLEQLPTAQEGNEIELSLATEGDIVICRLRLAEGFLALADTLFGVGRDLLVGVGQDQVWLATGPGSQELMIAKIKEAGDAETNDNVLSASIHLGPWVNRLYELAEEREQPEAVEERAAWREDLVQLKQMSESLVSDDELIIDVQSDAKKLSGSVELRKGFLTFIGRQIARLTKENLDL